MKSHPLALCSALLAAALASCDEPSGLFSQLRSELTVDATTIVIGQRYVGTHTRVAITLTSHGNTAVRATLEPQGDAATAFSVERKLVVNAESALRVEIDFVPDREGEITAVLVIAHDAESPSPLFLTLSGIGVPPPGCDDGNPCSEDWFDVGDEQCHHQDRIGLCDDGNACTEGDFCISGQCIGQPIVCRDLVDCTLDTCDPQSGCRFIPQHDTCSDDDGCTADVCNELIGCTNPPQPEGTPCGPLSCAEVALCFAGQCLHAPTPDGFPCEDGDVCTTGDTCQTGACQPGPGDPFQIVGPFEFAPSSSDSNTVSHVLAVARGAGGNFDVVYQMALLPPPEPCYTCACECCWTSYAGGEVHHAVVSRTGVVIEDTVIGQGDSARAQIRDGEIYLLAHQPGPADCADQEVLALTRIDVDGMPSEVRVVPPLDMVADEFALSVNLDQVAIGMLYLARGSSLRVPVEPVVDQMAAQLVLFSRDLAVASQRNITLTEASVEVASDLQLHFRGATLDLAYTAQAATYGDYVACSSARTTSSRLLTDVLSIADGTLLTLHSGLDDDQQLSLVAATFPAGLYLLRGQQDMTTVIDPPAETDGAEAQPGNACAPYEQVWLFSASATGSISHTQLVDHAGYQSLASAVAIGALGRLGALLLDDNGGLEAVVPAEGFIPEVRLPLTFPVETNRRWYAQAAPATQSLGSATFVAGISEDLDPYATCSADPAPPPNGGVSYVPPCDPVGRRIVVAGAGCGVGF